MIAGSSRNGTNGIVQTPDRRDFAGNIENNPLRSASSQFDLNIEQNEIDETRDFGNTEDGNFPTTKLNYDRRAHAHHSSPPTYGTFMINTFPRMCKMGIAWPCMLSCRVSVRSP